MIGFHVNVGLEVIDSFELNKLYSMPVPGAYHVTFSCNVPGKMVGDRLFVVASNELRINVLGPRN